MLVVSGNSLAGVDRARPGQRSEIATPMTAPLDPPGLPRRVLRTLLAIPLAIWIFLEEWVWDHVLTFMAWLGRLPPVHWVETKIAALPAYAALIAFLIPAAILLPFKLAAFWLIASGHKMLGVSVFIVAKIIGTAFLARIFSLTKNALLTIGWFNRAYFAITGWKERLYATVRALPAYQRVRAWAHAAKQAMRAWWRETFGAAR